MLLLIINMFKYICVYVMFFYLLSRIVVRGSLEVCIIFIDEFICFFSFMD